MDDLTAFIAARLAEDEAIALAARDAERLPWQDDEWNDQPAERTAHYARHDPARVLREVAAKRAMVALHKPDDDSRWPNCSECSCGGALAATDCIWTVSWPCPTIRLVAAVWSDHGDYRAGWAG